MSIGRDNTAARWLNEGEIRIRSGGRLTLRGVFEIEDLGTVIDEGANHVWLTGILDNQGKTLDLESLNLTVPLTLNGGTIRGGRIESSGDATLGFVEGSTNGGKLDGVTLATNIEITGSGGRVFVENGLTLDDMTLTIHEGADLLFTGGGPHTLSGIGTILAPDRPNTGAITNIGGDRLIIGEGIVIRNGTTQYRELVLGFQENRGLIIAEAPNTPVTITAGSSNGRWTNNGTIRALAGTVRFAGSYKTSDIGNLEVLGGLINLTGNVDNSGDVISQNAETKQWQFNANISGGRIESTDTVPSFFRGGTLTNVTLAGPSILGAGISNEEMWVRESLMFDDGSIVLSPRALLNFNTPATLDGRGEIYLNGTLANPALLQTYTGGAITIGPNVSVMTGLQGGGQISRFSLPLFNHGTISAQTQGQRLIVDGAFDNTGLLVAKNGSLLQIQASSWVNQGSLEVHPGSEIRITSSHFENGANGYLSGNGLIALTSATLINKGAIAPGNSIGTLNVTGSVELMPTSVLQIELGEDGAKDLLSASGNLMLGGVLEIFKAADFNAQLGRQYEILRSSLGQITGTFANSDTIHVGSVQFAIEYTSKSVFLTTVAIPEPSALLLLFSLAAMLWLHGSSKLQFEKRR